MTNENAKSQYQQYVDEFENMVIEEDDGLSKLFYRYEMTRPELFHLKNDKWGGVFDVKEIPSGGRMKLGNMIFLKGEENPDLGKLLPEIGMHMLRMAPWAVLMMAPVIVREEADGKAERIDSGLMKLIEKDEMCALPQVRSVIAISTNLGAEDMMRHFLFRLYQLIEEEAATIWPKWLADIENSLEATEVASLAEQASSPRDRRLRAWLRHAAVYLERQFPVVGEGMPHHVQTFFSIFTGQLGKRIDLLREPWEILAQVRGRAA